MDVTNFYELAEEYWQNDIEVVPIKDKAIKINNWPQKTFDEFSADDWNNATGIGLKCGSVNGIMAFDVDILKSEHDHLIYIIEEIEKQLPPVFIGRIGSPDKIPMRFFKCDLSFLRKKKLNSIHVEFLVDGNQCAIPPSHYNILKGTKYEWVNDRSLLDIDIDDLPDFPTDLFDWLFEQNEIFKKDKTNKVSNKLESSDQRCSHGSHNKLSEAGLAMLRKGKAFDVIVSELIALDKKINSESAFVYFACPSRKEFSGLDVRSAATKFVGEMFQRNAALVGTEKGLSVELNNSSDGKESYFTQSPFIDEVKPSESQWKIWDTLDLTRTQNGTVVLNEDNVLKILMADKRLKHNLYLDQFKLQPTIKKNGKAQPLSDGDVGDILLILQRQFGLSKLNRSTVVSAVDMFLNYNKKNPLLDYLNGLVWDGKPRVGRFFVDYCGSYDKNYERTVSRNWWISMVARALQPGCKVDTMVVLEGKQGIKKSTMLSVIGGDYYVENTTEFSNKDIYQNMHGALIYEFGEMSGLNRSEINKIKMFLTSSQDKYRPHYGRNAITVKRHGIFTGTTNESDYLEDKTGNRRFWPMTCRSMKLDDIRRDRDQLFAEAVSLFRAGESWWVESDVTHLVQEARRSADPWEDVVKKWATGRNDFKMHEVIEDCLNMEISKAGVRETKRLGAILRKLGYSSTPVNGARSWRYLPE